MGSEDGDRAQDRCSMDHVQANKCSSRSGEPLCYLQEFNREWHVNVSDKFLISVSYFNSRFLHVMVGTVVIPSKVPEVQRSRLYGPKIGPLSKYSSISCLSNRFFTFK